MGKKKLSNRLQDEQAQLEPSDSEDSQMQRKMDQFNSDQSWSDLDELQCQLFNGTHEVSSPEDMPKKPKKRDRQKQRQDEILQYQQALKIAQQQNTKFINPFEPYQLNVKLQDYQKMLSQVVEGTTPPQGIARMIGIKSLRILHQERLFTEFKMIQSYLQQLKLPENVIEAHKFLLASQGNVLYKQTGEQDNINLDD